MKIPIKTTNISYAPIILGLTTIPIQAEKTTGFEFSEDEIHNNFVIDHNTASYLDSFSFQENLKNFSIRSQLNSFYQKWKDQTMFLSDLNSIVNNSYFQKIIEYSDQAIPFILEKISIEPSTLVWALNIITELNISDNNRITVSEACKLWVNWGKQKNLV